MGYYINPAEVTKSEWLEQNATEISEAEAKAFDFNGDDRLLCHVDNYLFSALAVAYCPEERDAFADPNDTRHRMWYRASKQAVQPYYSD